MAGIQGWMRFNLNSLKFPHGDIFNLVTGHWTSSKGYLSGYLHFVCEDFFGKNRPIRWIFRLSMSYHCSYVFLCSQRNEWPQKLLILFSKDDVVLLVSSSKSPAATGSVWRRVWNGWLRASKSEAAVFSQKEWITQFKLELSYCLKAGVGNLRLRGLGK